LKSNFEIQYFQHRVGTLIKAKDQLCEFFDLKMPVPFTPISWRCVL